MRLAQRGDQVQVHYVKRFQDGSVVSSRRHTPLELTVGVDHPRLPGLGLALAGLAAGECTTVRVAAEQAYGLSDPGRVRRWIRTRFPEHQALAVGQWVHVLDRHGRGRQVRIVEIRDRVVVVDTNHRKAGQALELEVKLMTIHDAGASPGVRSAPAERPVHAKRGRRGARRRAAEAPAENQQPCPSKAVAVNVDAASLSSLREALPDWQIDVMDGASAGSLTRDWNPPEADLLVVGSHEQVTETLGLCRSLRSQAGRAHTPLLVLVLPAQETLVRAVLEAGANSCLVLPVHVKELVSVVDRAREGNQPGRHTLALDRAQGEDHWRDDGGQG